LQTILHLLLLSLVELVNLLGIIILVGFMLGFLEKWTVQVWFRAFGWKGIAATAWLGTPAHELSHALMCIVFGHRITEIRWLQLNSGDGTLGYVSHQYNPNSIYQKVGNFFIGTAPVFMGILNLTLGMHILVPESYVPFVDAVYAMVREDKSGGCSLALLGGSIAAVTQHLFTTENFANPRFWLYCLLAVCISSHIALSAADLKGAFNGCVTIFGVIVLLNLLSFVFGFHTDDLIAKIAAYNLYIIAFSSVAILFSLLWLFAGMALCLLKGRRT